MHTNISISRDGKNLFYDAKGQDQLSKLGWQFIDRILHSASDICLVLSSSVNAYRRLDPHFEAPNEIKASAIHRGAMIRVPLGNEQSKRIEVRAVAPDANPYLAVYTLLQTGFGGPDPEPEDPEKRPRTRMLPDTIYAAMREFKRSPFVGRILGEDIQAKYLQLKEKAAERCPRALGTRIKAGEIMFHHEVTNQMLWSQF
jgi:glutamine synthetase